MPERTNTDDSSEPDGRALPTLPTTFGSTRESLRTLACYVVSPARKARTGRIGLRPTGRGFGTPPFDDGSRIAVRGNQLERDPGEPVVITTLRAAAEFVGVELSADPGVGHDLPPYTPDVDLAVDGSASLALGAWYSFGQRVLDELGDGSVGGTISEAQLWPEHFDLAVTVALDASAEVNVGFSPGDGFEPEPYVYVGPHSTDELRAAYWNAPFGACLRYGVLTATDDPARAALDFIVEGLDRLGSPAPGGSAPTG